MRYQLAVLALGGPAGKTEELCAALADGRSAMMAINGMVVQYVWRSAVGGDRTFNIFPLRVLENGQCLQ